MLAVWKLAWTIRTICPGRRFVKLMVLPKRFFITVASVVTNKVWLSGTLGLPVSTELLPGFTEIILAVVTLAEAAKPIRANMKNAFVCGGMLLVMAGEKIASIHMPSWISSKQLQLPAKLMTAVFLLTFSCKYSRASVPSAEPPTYEISTEPVTGFVPEMETFSTRALFTCIVLPNRERIPRLPKAIA